MWQQGARTINPKGRENKDHAANPNISYLGEHPPESIGLRASSDGPPGCKPVFQSAVPRFGAPDPSFPGPGHYDITDPVDWQRHDKVIKLDTHLFKVRPSHQFELPKVKPLLNNKKEQPGPGWYETQRRQQTGEAPSAPAWQPVASEQVQTCDKSPPSHFKLADDSSVWSSAGRAAARTMSGAVRSRFETAVSATHAHTRHPSLRCAATRRRGQRIFCAVTCQCFSARACRVVGRSILFQVAIVQKPSTHANSVNSAQLGSVARKCSPGRQLHSATPPAVLHWMGGWRNWRQKRKLRISFAHCDSSRYGTSARQGRCGGSASRTLQGRARVATHSYSRGSSCQP